MPTVSCLSHQKGDLQFCADAVGSADENRRFHAGKIGLEQPAESADSGNHTRDFRALHMAFHQFNRPITGGHVNPGGLIAFAEAFHPFSSVSVQSFPASS